MKRGKIERNREGRAPEDKRSSNAAKRAQSGTEALS